MHAHQMPVGGGDPAPPRALHNELNSKRVRWEDGALPAKRNGPKILNGGR